MNEIFVLKMDTTGALFVPKSGHFQKRLGEAFPFPPSCALDFNTSWYTVLNKAYADAAVR